MSARPVITEREFDYHSHMQTWTLTEQRMAIMIIGLSHIPLVYSTLQVGQTQGQGRWHVFTILFYTLSSIFHNIASMLKTRRVYLHYKTWKKLSYISGISLWNMCLIYFMDFSHSKHPWLGIFLQYAQFAAVVVLQEKKPDSFHWNWYPIIIHVAILFACHIYNALMHRQWPQIHRRKNLLITIALFGIALLAIAQVKKPFTFDPRKDNADYLGIYHSLCDFCIGVAFQWFWKIMASTKHPEIKSK